MSAKPELAQRRGMTCAVNSIAGGGLVMLALLISSCNAPGKTQKPAALPPPIVSVMTVEAADVPIYSEFTAQTYARDLVEIRGRVDGYIEKRLFQIGSEVQPGQVLYQLDLRPYQADVAKSKGRVGTGRGKSRIRETTGSLLAGAGRPGPGRSKPSKSQQDVERLVPLVKQDAASRRISTMQMLPRKRIWPT